MQRIVASDVPESLKSRALVNLDLGSMAAGAKYRGEFEKRLRVVLDEIKESNGQITTFISEIHTIVGTGAMGDGSADVGDMIKPALARGRLRLVDVTALDECHRYIEKGAALECRSQQIFVSEPSVEDTIGTLRSLGEHYEIYHGVRIQDSALAAAAMLPDRYIASRFLPDKAIGLVSEATSRLRVGIDSLLEEINFVERIVRRLEIEEMVPEEETDIVSKERLDRLCEELAGEREKLNTLKTHWQNKKSSIDDVRSVREKPDILRTESEKAEREDNYGRVAEPRYGRIPELEKKLEAAEESVVDAKENSMLKEETILQEVAEVVSAWTGIPAGKMIQGETEKSFEMELNLGHRVVGQNVTVEVVSDIVRRLRASAADLNRPTGSFLSLGPTGVGKTELTKTLAELFFDDEHAMVRIDMSECGEKHSVIRLIGASPGYIDYDVDGQLTEAVRRRPYTVVFFDEVEKAHPGVFGVFLQVLDEGRLTDGQGQTVDFRDTIPILILNLGAGDTYEQIMDAVRMAFEPEFISCLDDVVIFNPLTFGQLRGIVGIQVRNLAERLEAHRLMLDIADGALDWLLERGYDPTYGARPLCRLMQKAIGGELTRRLLVGDVHDGDYVEITVADDGESPKVVGYNENGAVRVQDS